MPSIVVLTGGGIQGAVVAARAAQDTAPTLVHIDHGHASAGAEAAAVRALARALPGAGVLTLELPPAGPIRKHADGSKNEDSRQKGRPASSAVPSRALMPTLLSVAVRCAQRIGASAVVTGVSRRIDTTHVGLPVTDGMVDRPREFLHAYNVMLDTLTPPSVTVLVNAPLMDLTYAQVVALAFRFRVPFEHTYSCTQPGPKPCAKCEPCKARAAALAEVDMVDPLIAPATT